MAVIWDENGTPTGPQDAAALVIVGAGRASTVSVSVFCPVPTALVALNVTVETPAPVGVPDIRPVAVSTERPAGGRVAPKLVGSLDVVIQYANAVPTAPVAVGGLVMTGAAGVPLASRQTMVSS